MKLQSKQPFNDQHLYASWAALILFLVYTALLAGCVTQDPRLTAALNTVKIIDVRVDAAPKPAILR